MSDFDYLRQDAALSRVPLDPPDEQCHAWAHVEGCDCPTVADLEAMDADFRNKARKEDL